MGEAAANVSAAGRALAPGIEWAEIVGMRNRLVHAYFDINTDILWATAMVSLPTLLQRLQSNGWQGTSIKVRVQPRAPSR